MVDAHTRTGLVARATSMSVVGWSSTANTTYPRCHLRAIVQCKRYRDTVGEEIVRGLFGTLLHETAHHAFLVTTADISSAAAKWAAGKPMTLIDGPTLVDIAQAIDEATRD